MQCVMTGKECKKKNCEKYGCQKENFWEEDGRPRMFYSGGTFNIGKAQNKLSKAEKKLSKRRKFK